MCNGASVRGSEGHVETSSGAGFLQWEWVPASHGPCHVALATCCGPYRHQY